MRLRSPQIRKQRLIQKQLLLHPWTEPDLRYPWRLQQDCQYHWIYRRVQTRPAPVSHSMYLKHTAVNLQRKYKHPKHQHRLRRRPHYHRGHPSYPCPKCPNLPKTQTHPPCVPALQPRKAKLPMSLLLNSKQNIRRASESCQSRRFEND
ncbi:unnamed protein product [Leptidea sinapis]|uniref:Uncharacterized protein n=1 Tax=Leptidea sinapis TaxID=189913 RepID=A0A5E4Q293_9NEOP|nr:unnamed protein product [Leptidea sinapis]